MKKLIGRRITCEPTGRESECWGPIIHHLAGKALNDQEIASKLNLAESNVQGCISAQPAQWKGRTKWTSIEHLNSQWCHLGMTW